MIRKNNQQQGKTYENFLLYRWQNLTIRQQPTVSVKNLSYLPEVLKVNFLSQNLQSFGIVRQKQFLSLMIGTLRNS